MLIHTVRSNRSWIRWSAGLYETGPRGKSGRNLFLFWSLILQSNEYNRGVNNAQNDLEFSHFNCFEQVPLCLGFIDVSKVIN